MSNTPKVEWEEQFDKKFTYGGKTGAACLNPEKYNDDDPRPFRDFIASQLTAFSKEVEEKAKQSTFGHNDEKLGTIVAMDYQMFMKSFSEIKERWGI